MYSRQQIVTLATEMTQDQVSKLTLLAWLDVAIQQVVDHKRAWWRRKTFTLSSVAGTPTYDLKTAGLNLADDFHEMIGLYRIEGSRDIAQLTLVSDPLEIAKALSDTSQGEPGGWLPELGSEKVLRLSPTPSSVWTFRGVYWAAPNLSFDNTNDAIPLIPGQFHYVPLLRFVAKLFEYLYGIKDQRYVSSLQEYQTAQAALDRYQPGAQAAVELRTRDSGATVRSTS